VKEKVSDEKQRASLLDSLGSEFWVDYTPYIAARDELFEPLVRGLFEEYADVAPRHALDYTHARAAIVEHLAQTICKAHPSSADQTADSGLATVLGGFDLVLGSDSVHAFLEDFYQQRRWGHERGFQDAVLKKARTSSTVATEAVVAALDQQPVHRLMEYFKDAEKRIRKKEQHLP
jgi:hypothetical protein